uniref:Uncharacterized protein n=1 Tax=Salix viminalis TaxID=40686 RepID=A0A6N2KHA4_SALVM
MATGQAPSNPVPAMRTYQPVEHPVVVIGQQYLAHYYVELAGKRKLLTLHDRRFIKDAAGNTLVNLGKKIMTMHGSWEAFRGESNEEKDLLFTIKKSKLIQFKTELDVFLANNKGEVPDFKVKGGYSECSYSVLLGDTNTVIAHMHGKHSPKSIILEVYPNVDYAFIIAL